MSNYRNYRSLAFCGAKILTGVVILLIMSHCTDGFERFIDEEPADGPRIFSTSPVDGADSVDSATDGASVKIVFDRSMTTTTTLPDFYISDLNDNGETENLKMAVDGSTGTWSTTNSENDTLTVQLSWVRFPENSRILVTLSRSAFTDTKGQSLLDRNTFKFTTTWSGNDYDIVKTGQFKCYENTSGWAETATCEFNSGSPSTINPPGQNGYFDDTDGIGKARFDPGTYPQQHGTYTKDYISQDVKTGLIWKTCSQNQPYDGSGSADDICLNTPEDYTWPQAVNACASLNSMNNGAGFYGRTDWRLPTIAELETLPDYGIYNDKSSIGYSPAIQAFNTNGSIAVMDGPFPNTAEAAYWSTSTLSVVDPDSGNTITNAGWSIDFDNGAPDVEKAGRDELKKVRCVAGGTAKTRTFTDNGDGTVTAKVDGSDELMWQKCSAGQSGSDCSVGTATKDKWPASLIYCDNLSLAGHNDWRAPNLNELKSLIKLNTTGTRIDTSAFPNTITEDPDTSSKKMPFAHYWSSTTFVNPAESFKNAWTVDFSTGAYFSELVPKENDFTKAFLRCVRDVP